MSDERRWQRVEKLLAISENRERAARQAFDRARATAEENHARLVECERELIDRHEEARRRLLAGGPAESSRPYRDAVTALRQRITELMTERMVADSRLEKRRAELMEAMTRRRAVQIVRERLAARQATADARRQTRMLDDAHAAGRRWRRDMADSERQET